MIRYKELGNVLKDTWPVGLVFWGIAICWGVAYCLACSLSDQILYAGTLLQMFGLITVAIGISQLRRMFGKPSLFERITNWLQKLIGAFRKSVSIEIHNGMHGMVAGGSAIAGTLCTSPETLETRVEKLEKALNVLKEQHGKMLRTLEDNLSRVESLVHDEGNKRQLGDADISKMLEEVAVGGIHLEVVGLVWLLLGMFGTSIPKELAKLL